MQIIKKIHIFEGFEDTINKNIRSNNHHVKLK